MMMLSRFLRAVIKSGDLCLLDHKGRDWRFGDGTAPHVSVQIHDRATQWQLFMNPQLTVGEAYMRGTLTIERGTLYDFLDIAARNLQYVQA
ncbi:MAG: SAM-dependent methyltransferase, partial [Alphaproteobacteria bacterium]|nr:SAM-dependent methyltransferase [Alphaproteobacteria bacterium]